MLTVHWESREIFFETSGVQEGSSSTYLSIVCFEYPCFRMCEFHTFHDYMDTGWVFCSNSSKPVY